MYYLYDVCLCGLYNIYNTYIDESFLHSKRVNEKKNGNGLLGTFMYYVSFCCGGWSYKAGSQYHIYYISVALKIKKNVLTILVTVFFIFAQECFIIMSKLVENIALTEYFFEMQVTDVNLTFPIRRF